MLNLFVRAGRLVGELVAGEVEDLEALVMVLLIQSFQAFVLRGAIELYTLHRESQ